MFCEKCGAPLADDAKFCEKCGSSIIAEGTAPAAEPKQEFTPPSYIAEEPGRTTQQEIKKPMSLKHCRSGSSCSFYGVLFCG